MALRHRIDHEHDHGAALVETESSSVREPFGVGQIVSLAAGIFFVVIGAVGLARAGVDSPTEPAVEVMGLGMTPLLAIAHLLIGAFLMAGASGRGLSRAMLGGLGPVLVVAGIVALIQGVDSLGWNQVNGLAYIIAGATAIAAALLTPMTAIHERRVVSV